MIFRNNTTLRVLVVVALVATVLAAPVAAAPNGSDNGSNDGPTVGIDVGTGGGGNEQTNTTIATVDPATRVVDYSLDGGELTLVVEAEVRKPITVLEAADPDAKSGTVSVQQTILSMGRNTITLDVGQGETTVYLSTSTSINNGRVAYVTVGDEGGIEFPGPVTWSHVFMASGIAGVGGVGIAVSLFKASREGEEEPEVERFV